MASFITEHMEEILVEWEEFAGTMSPAADSMDRAALRDHARQMLQAIARDIATAQTQEQQELKSKGLAPVAARETAAAAHGVLRQNVGFDLGQLIAEFRALRASVLRIWMAKKRYGDEQAAYEIARFHEAIDQALCESAATYSAELEKSRDTFLGILGHDLRTPLGAVWAAVAVMDKSNDADVRASASRAASRSLVTMRTMIADLLDFTRTRLGKGIPVMPEAADLEAVCRASIAEVALAFPDSSIRFAAEGALHGEFDRDRLHQVISNLLGNALEHGDRGTDVAVIAEGDPESLGFAVSNRGPVIPPSQLLAIFEPLVQLDGEAQRGSSNLGLGLYIAREIVLAHGGTIEATSAKDTGTTFKVKIPRAVSRSRAATPETVR